ncbi:prepilin-type N-terminal cleavage/methylation domain-containing protein, partial [Patescibacteria group bacterium]
MNMKRGMTLIEVVVAIGMITLVMVAVSDSAISLYRANTLGVGSMNQISQGRRAAQLITTDIRQTNIGSNGANAISTMSPY